MKAVKQYAALLGIADYQPQELARHAYSAVIAWESNVLLEPGNPVLVTQLAWSYTALADIDLEISGWWRIFEQHPFQISILKLLHKACLQKYEKQAKDLSLLKFIKLCAMRLLADCAGRRGIKHLDWWPLASEEDLMLLQPYMQKQQWKNVSPVSIYVLIEQERTGVSGYDWVSRPSLRDNKRLLPGISHPQSTSSVVLLEQNDHESSGQAALGSEAPFTRASSESSLLQHETLADDPLDLSLPQDPGTTGPDVRPLAAGRTSVGDIVALPERVHLRNMQHPENVQSSNQPAIGDNSTLRQRQPLPSQVEQRSPEESLGTKVVPLALCLSNRLLEPKIIIQNSQIWDDSKVMQTIQDAYWGERGGWKRVLTRIRIWPWKILKHMGNAKMRIYAVSGKNESQCDKLKPYPLEDQQEDVGPTDSQWRTYFNNPEKCEERATWLRLHLHKYDKDDGKITGGYTGTDCFVLYFEHGLAVGVLATLIGGVAFACVLYWAVAQHSLSTGLAVFSAIVGFFGFVLTCYFNALRYE